MIDMENNLKYVKVDKYNYKIAYNIQKQIWEDEPDLENFKSKANSQSSDNVSWIVLYNNEPIGITGIYTEDFDGIQDGKFLNRGLKNCEIKEYEL